MAATAAHNARPNRESLSKRLGKVARLIAARDGHACVYCGTDGMVCVDGAEGQDAVRVAASLPGWLARAKAARLAIVEAREAATRV